MTSSIQSAFGIDAVQAAASRISPHVRETPLWRLRSGDLGLPVDYEIWMKLEQFQVSGSFKARGIFNRLLSNPVPASGVIAASGGNAGIATAFAAKALNVLAEIYVPELISSAKRQRLENLGAKVVIGGQAYADALVACQSRQFETGALMTHAYDQPEVVLGSSVLAREIELQAGGPPDTVLVSVGGGGLIGGIAAWFENRSRIVALEPELAATFHRSLEAGMPVDVPVGGIAADSLGSRRIGEIAWSVAQRHVHQSILLRDEAIRDAQLFMWRAIQIAVEPAAALPLAALRCGLVRPRKGEKVCLIICGANVDPASLA
jgi:threonine dehydratase